MTIALLILAVLWLAWSNGANDNFKGVATLYGSRTCSYRAALAWATTATVAGSLVSLLLAGRLAAAFSGAGLVPHDVAGTAAFASAVAAAGATTIFAATLLGMPTSTTHALIGALGGAAIASGATIAYAHLLAVFLIPLAISPILAITATGGVYPILSALRRKWGLNTRTCVCIGQEKPQPIVMMRGGEAILAGDDSGRMSVRLDDDAACVERYDGRVIGINAQCVVDGMHYLSGASVCFARAVNDTPKIAALLLVAGASFTVPGLLLVTAAMAIGGLVQSRRVAQTMSRRITEMNTGQGLTANVMTSGLVLGASSLGVPVSTTHVSCGSIFGIGIVRGSARWKTIGQILVTWLTTLPAGVLLGALFGYLFLAGGGFSS